MTGDTGKVVTVAGSMDPDELGVTLPHEHVFADVTNWYSPPESAYERKIAREPVKLENLAYIRQNLYGHKDNMRLESMEEAVEEVELFHQAGGDTIVDLTPKHVGRDPERVRQVSRATGVRFVHGTGYYTRSAHPEYLDEMTEEEIEQEFVSDVKEGIGDTDVRAGIIGEIGVSGRIHEEEERVLRGAARAAVNTGAPLNIHTPGRTPHSQKNRTHPPSRWALTLLDITMEEGLAADRVVMSHLDRTIYEDLRYQKEVAERGAFIEYDLWGLEAYLQEYEDGLPSDIRRGEWIMELIEEGYESRLLFSHDVWSKIQRRRYGGYGYAHVLENIIPMLRSNGATTSQLSTITVDNPRNLLTFDDPS